MELEALLGLGLTEEQAQAVMTEQAKETEVIRLDAAAEAYAGNLRFTSELARRAFVKELKGAGLTRDEAGNLTGADAFTKAMRAANPGAFAMEAAGGFGFAGKEAAETNAGDERDAIRLALFPGRE